MAEICEEFRRDGKILLLTSSRSERNGQTVQHERTNDQGPELAVRPFREAVWVMAVPATGRQGVPVHPDQPLAQGDGHPQVPAPGQPQIPTAPYSAPDAVAAPQLAAPYSAPPVAHPPQSAVPYSGPPVAYPPGPYAPQPPYPPQQAYPYPAQPAPYPPQFAAPLPPPVYTREYIGTGFHILHISLSVITGGCWLPVYGLLYYMKSRPKTVTTYGR